MNTDQERTRLMQLYHERGAIQFGDFVLASGQRSSFYLNSKEILFHPEGLDLLAEILYQETRDLKLQALGGLEIGAIPMTAAFLMACHWYDRSMEGFFVRKKEKDHGVQKRLEGRVNPGDKVVVVDDVLTTGSSALQAIQAVEAFGATVVRVVCICDRGQGSREALAGYDVRALFTVGDFGIEPQAG